MDFKINSGRETLFPYEIISKYSPRILDPAFNIHEIHSKDPILPYGEQTKAVYTHFPHYHNLHEDLLYRVNIDGFCGNDLLYNPDILAIGCSITVPMGIPHQLSWPHIIAKKLNMSVNVVAYPGSPIDRIVLNCIKAIEKYGKPKKIFFLIPNLTRLWIGEWSSDRKEYNKKQINWSWEYNNFFVQTKTKSYKTFSYKDFFNIKRSIPLELVVQNAFSSLDMLESFCNINNIDFRFFSWNEFTDQVIDSRGYDSFTEQIEKNHLYSGDKNAYLLKNCHEPEDEQSDIFWSTGLDYPTPHPGVHEHIHYAERFLHNQNNNLV